ncbi:arsenate reductase (glutaredoxin) [Komagataeibacter rhaeticus]|uniref:Arsenate reductase n=1 Tax=Komagataeibacter rhaeticus TaxID=215221 RepID=A0A181C9M8_9PROT|nr:arsenate reductase (glutaredoxin) [Komagataeibacter rhaeticus]ATU73162.1 arsenate reductase (glutaredoxin) [Komagataeibacter xylinus]MBL7241046.1 arsenate reductase (glutaredoxin) [Komagataeibacter rhaeticus]PYD54378.1 arsenate reductase (glutaredoxin) [Komagataeibacter rhaeticus]QIP35097.1 arsenate reductase (glutaredoxin) [Komagataeibacter rhaeticus]QOC47652.1 arsenate reductase (glutaredoxin) [Komagataeibacter rhaeticus]
MSVTLYHNPACGTSRNVLAMIRAAGIEPVVVEYLKTPPTRAELDGLAARLVVPVRDLLRVRGTPYAELGLDDPALTDGQILDAIAAHPVLLNRPVVMTDQAARPCRPKEILFEILPQARPATP